MEIHGENERRGNTRGFTLLEMMIALTLLGGVLIAMGLATKTASSTYDEGRLQDELDTRAHRALERITTCFADAERNGLTPEPSEDMGGITLSYRHPQGYEDGAIVWGDLTTIEWQLEEGEVDDGADNNGNGLVDEGVVVLLEDVGGADESRTVLVHGVPELLEGEVANVWDDNDNGLMDEGGLSFALEGDVLTIRLTVQTTADGGRVVTKTVRSAVRVRN